ncbi:ead/Ea22-like family protein [Escherichia coli]|uniref:ead/Ea22-like family protein n=1 Tax=Escherichia coli TaxID=562 RepID=UPI001DC55151|nr:ead/Ea22-like family protein [Escherichia coli]EES6589455.1 ead/Ea22-like family protein [Escherichia coli]EEX6076830.1 ead/Ea22-like family protein [Escherichia coli]EIZ4974685.1 ead/Ea22-like family protein [Escherichia coli]ELX9772223.1 ead/Ea22-like family protein [Escherichia coli]
MSNIDKRALRHSAESIIGILENIAGFEPSDIDGDSVELRFETEDGFDTGCDVSIVDQCQKTADVILALLDELEAAEALNKHLELAIRKAEGCSEALRRKTEASEKRIAELEAREIKPAKGEVLVVVSGFTGCGKSAIAGEIEIAMKAIGVPVQWTNGDAEKRMTGADWLTEIEMCKPTVRIVEVNVPRAAGIRIKGE